MKKWFHVFFKNRWGRGQPDDIGAINLGDEKFDPDSDKKPRAGQILWIRGLTRLQTQVTIPISLFSLSLSHFILSFSVTLSLFLILSLSHHSIQDSIFSRVLLFTKTEVRKPNKKPPPDPTDSGGKTTRVTYGPLKRNETLRTLFFSFLYFISFF